MNQQQKNEDNKRTNDIERNKRTQDQAHEDAEKTKRIEELKKKQKED